jgi:hypothetical protein
LGVVHPDAVKICRWPKVLLAPGLNRIEAVGRRDGKEIRDQCAWTVAAAPAGSLP